MKRKINNSGRQVRSQEEIAARREARRKYYEEMDAFERDLPDFIFADSQADTEEYYFDEEDEERTGGEAFSEEKEDTPAVGVPEEEKTVEDITGYSGENIKTDAVESDRSVSSEKENGTDADGKETAETDAGTLDEKRQKYDYIMLEDGQERTKKSSPSKKSGSTGKKRKASSAGTSGNKKGTAGVKKGSVGSKKGAAGVKKGSTGAKKGFAVLPGKKKRKKRRRRRKNLRPFILAASLAVVFLGGGLFGMHALGIIGGKEIYEVYVNETLVGKVLSTEEGRDTYLQVRREVVSQSEAMVLMEADCDIRRVETIIKVPSDTQELQENMKQALEENIVGTLDKAYTVKINDYIVNLKDKTEVVDLLEAVKSPYDQENEYSVQLVADTSKELTMLTTQVVKTEESADIAGVAVNEEDGREEQAGENGEVPEGEESDTPPEDGEESEENQEQEDPSGEEALPEATGENDGLKEVSFVESIEIAESYVTADSITPLDQAVSDITKEKEENKIYEVTSGDCLSIVAEKNDMTVAKLLELNEDLQEDTVIQIGDEIVVTTPEPELSVITQEEISYEEDYEEDVQYVDNDSWYTTKEVVQQEASTGHRKVTALVTYRNGKETGREIIAQTIVTPAVPKIIERGTQTPPTYIKPISGGRYSSGYGKRWGRMHKGVDWACSVGTAVKASCGGTVVSAGWSNGYGYCITLRHPDGRQTRYAHLSKILVRSGQKVKQGDKIALSGNTGRSTGPHLHFEILINGSQVNPLKYLN